MSVSDPEHPDPDELPSTLARSPEKAQRTFAKAEAGAAGTRADDRAYQRRVAYSALKHTHEKVGDHWEPKDEAGPSDDQAARDASGGSRSAPDDTAGGVDANATKKHLYELARRLDVSGRSTMSKAELVEALQKANDRETRRAREDTGDG